MTATLALGIAGLGLSAVGMVAEGIRANQQAKFQARVQRQQAERERLRGEAEAADRRRQSQRLLARQRALLAGSGVDPGVGSALLLQEDTAAEEELAALRTEAGFKTSATRLEQQAELTRASGRGAQRAGVFRAGSRLLSGTSQLLS